MATLDRPKGTPETRRGRRGLSERERAAAMANLAQMAHDEDYQREARQVSAEFANADTESARLIQE